MQTTRDANVVVVTGGAGFVGSHLIERLREDRSLRIISLDNYSTGSRDNHIPGVEYREGHTKDIARLVPETPDRIYHLGEYSRVAKSLGEPGKVWDLNIAGTTAVCEYWREKKCKLVYAGSSTKFTEARADGVSGRDLAPYTWAKAAMSELVANYSRWYDLPYVTVYFYNVYGPRELTDAYGALIGIFKKHFLEEKSLPVRSPGTQVRNFTHVDDTVSGILLAAEKGSGDGYGIGARDTHSLLDVARMFGGAIEMLPETPTTRSAPDVDASKLEELGWKQTKSLAEYIAGIVASKDS